MAYRRFTRPVSTGWTASQWITWLASQGVTPSVTAYERGVCLRCFGPTNTDLFGDHYSECYACRFVYDGALDALLPICFSVQEGMESAIWRAKNDPTHDWLRFPLASLLHQFLERHLGCLQRSHGTFDIVTVVPSHTATRGGVDHLKRLIGSVRPWRQPWDVDLLTKTTADKAETARQQIRPGQFVVTPGRDVRGRRVLLVDDTYTSGSTTVSAAFALKEAGAATVAAVTLGRQLRRESSQGQELVQSLPQRGLLLETCGAHSPFQRPYR